MGRLFYSVIFLFACLLFQTTSFGQAFTLVRDVNHGPDYDAKRPTNLTEAGGSLFFTIGNGPVGGLWKSDGSDAGTQIKAVSSPETIGTLVNLNGVLFFTISNYNTATTELWKSDGTPIGTVVIKSLPIANTSLSSFRIRNLTSVNGRLHFTFKPDSDTEQLWVSDGTSAGTTLLKSTSFIERLVNVNGTLFFTAAGDGTDYNRLWKSDGTPVGTVLVKDIKAGAGNPGFLTLYNADGTLFFTASDGVNGEALWKSDGTDAGTVLVKDIEPGTGFINIQSFAVANGIVYFFANTTADGNSLWKSDGTSVGTELITASDANPSFLTNVNGTLYFQGYDATNGPELWKSNGTAAGTIVVKDINPGPGGSFPASLFSANAVLYFTANSGDIWKSDGTDAGTVLVKDGFGGVPDYVTQFTLVNGVTYFAAFEPQYGYELWKTDGTTAGTTLVENLVPSPDGNPRKFVAANGVVYFSSLNYVNSPHPILGEGVFQTDGTFSGTIAAESIGRYHSTPLELVSHNGELFFSGMRWIEGYELWKISGNGTNATRVKNINISDPPQFTDAGSNPSHLTSVGQFLYFSADDGTNGNELWKTDGTEAGTVLVKNINPGGSSNPGYLVNVNGTLFFIADNGTDGIELWKSDGTEAGTVLVKNINTGGGNTSVPSLLTAVNGTLFFGANDGVHGYELWKSDGTEAGTVMVKDINGLPTTSNLEQFTNINGILYFTAIDGIHGREAWKSDGTEAGTVLLKDIYAGPTGSHPSSFTTLNGIILFAADDGIAGYELWGSDGTEAGTVLVKDIVPGAGSSGPGLLTKVGGNVLFTAYTDVTGVEIWLSNGAESGTRLMGQIQPGTGGSNPTEIFEFGSKVLVAATHELFGYEVWIADVPAGSPLPLDLLEFKGAVVNDDGILKWKTDNESNTSSFIVERSLDGRSYSSIGSVSAASSPGVHYYDFTDINIVSLGANNIYYRLKQTDIDGRYTYSNIVVLSIDNKKPIVMLYPNPTKDRINMTITISQSEKLQWQLTDNTGRTIKKGFYNLSAGSTALSIDVANLASGTYLVQLNGTSLQKVFKIVKQ